MRRPMPTLAAATALAFLVAGCSSDGATDAGDTPLPTGTGRAPTSTTSTTASSSSTSTSTPSVTSGTSAPSTSTPSGSSSGAGTSTSVDTDATTSSGVNSNGLPPGLTTPEAKRAEKFVRDYLTTYNTAAKDPNEMNALDRYADKSCRVCTGLKNSIADMKSKKRRIASDQIKVIKLVTDPTEDPSILKVYAEVRQTPVDVLDPSGKKVGSVDVNGKTTNSYDVRNGDNVLKIIQIRRVVGGIE